jgi:hypothetical protein
MVAADGAFRPEELFDDVGEVDAVLAFEEFGGEPAWAEDLGELRFHAVFVGAGEVELVALLAADASFEEPVVDVSDASHFVRRH